MAEPNMSQEIGKPAILIVDDEKIIRDLCLRALSDYRTFSAANGAEALQVLERQEIDLILTDVMMPQMNGLDLLQTVKEQEPNQAVVIMTGFTEKEVILRALQADADDFISKPINLLQLKTTIQKALERKALRQELLEFKRLDRLKTDFLGLISHKLKTPITVISLFMQNLAQGIGEPRGSRVSPFHRLDSGGIKLPQCPDSGSAQLQPDHPSGGSSHIDGGKSAGTGAEAQCSR